MWKTLGTVLYILYISPFKIKMYMNQINGIVHQFLLLKTMHLCMAPTECVCDIQRLS